MKLDEIQKKLEKLLTIDRGEYFIVNSDFECRFFNKNGPKGLSFSAWKKDNNSPSEFCFSEQLLVFGRSGCAKHYIGSIQLQRDPKLHDGKSFAVLLLKDLRSTKSDESKWDKMLEITSLFV